MTQKEVIDYCLTMKGTYLDFPFGIDFLVIKVKSECQEKGRIIAQFFELKNEPKITFCCSYEGGLYFRSLFPGKVIRGYHCPLVQQPYFNTFTNDGSISDEAIIEMASHSYKTVISKMPKYVQRELLQNNDN